MVASHASAKCNTNCDVQTDDTVQYNKTGQFNIELHKLINY